MAAGAQRLPAHVLHAALARMDRLEAEAGTTVYAVPNTPVVLLSVNGRTVSALLSDFFEE